MPVPTLLDLSQRLCLKNIRQLDDVGDIPYANIRFLLLKLDNPDQLRRIELASPHLLGQDGEVWLNFIKNDIPRWETRQLKPKNPTKWWELYTRLQADVAIERQESEKRLQEALNKHQSAKEESRSTFIAKALDPGKTGRATHLKRWNGDRTSLEFQHGRVVGTKGDGSGSWARTAFAKPKLTPLEKVVKHGSRDPASASRMATPTHLLGNRSSRVTQVPKGMLTPPARPAAAATMAGGGGGGGGGGAGGAQAQLRQRRVSPDRNAVKIFAPRKPSKSDIDRALDHEVARERERRLKAIQMGLSPGKGKAESSVVVSPPAVAASPPAAKEVSPGPGRVEKAESSEKSGLKAAGPPVYVKKRKVESVFMTSKKRRV